MTSLVNFNIASMTSQPIIQQDLKNCRLRSVPFCTSSLFFLLSILYAWLFCAFGLPMLYSKSIEVQYDNFCNESTCIVPFELPYDMKAPIGLYYKLSNFEQNRRDLASSFSPEMLAGEKPLLDSFIKSQCDPRTWANNKHNINNTYIPCGLLPYAVFNDTFSLIDDDSFIDKEIVLNVDEQFNYQKPHPEYANSLHWLEDNGLFDGGQTNPHFIVWMRQSAFSPFRKLYAVSQKNMAAGKYQLSIRNNYKAESFSGHKYFIFTEIGNIGTYIYGPVIVYGTMFIFFLIAAGILGFVGWLRMKPTSRLNPLRLMDNYATSSS